MVKGASHHYEYICRLRGGDIYIVYPIDKVVYEGESRYQKIKVVDMPFGRALILDGVLQLTTFDEEIYHKGLVLPAIKADYHNILILGGGDGGAAREVRKALPRCKITIVDIDPMVTKVVNTYLPEVPSNIFNDKNVSLINKDAFKYVDICCEKYDYILVDLTDVRDEWLEGSQVNILYSENFLLKLKNILSKGGRIVYHVSGLVMGSDLIGKFWSRSIKFFKYTIGYGIHIPTFIDIWCYVVLSERPIRLKSNIKYIKLKNCLADHNHNPLCFI